MNVQTKEITFQEIAQTIIETVASKDFPQIAQRAKEKEIIVKYQDAYDETMKKEEENLENLKKKKEITQEEMKVKIQEKAREMRNYFVNLQEQEQATLQEEVKSGKFQENLSKRADVSVNFVGGVVRDEVLGVESHDKDINLTGITEFEFQELFPQAEYQGKDFGVFRMFAEGEITEFAFSRTEKKVEGLLGHKAFEVQTSPYTTLEEDLYRRDITINAMAKNVLTGEIVDPYGGLNDLKNGIIRATSEAFKEDPLRVLRVARFAAKFGFSVDVFTKDMMSEVGSALGAISKERVHGEFIKMLSAKNPSIFFETLREVMYEENREEKTLLSIHFDVLDAFATKNPAAFGVLLETIDTIQTKNDLIKIAALTHLLSPEEARSLMVGIKASKEETQLAAFIATYYKDMVSGMTDAEKIESFLQDLTKHPFTRQRESEEWFYEAVEVIAEANDLLEVVEENHLKFRHMIAVLSKEIKPDLSLKGKAVGDDLRKRRVEKINELQSLPADPGVLGMKRAFRFEKPSVYFRALKEEGRLDEHYKELVPLVGMPQNERHHPEGEVFEHAMQCLDAAAFLAKEHGLFLHEKEKVLFSVYGHDLGKAVTLEWKEKVLENGEIVKVPTHHKHEYLGMKILKFMAKEKTYPVHWMLAAQYAAEYHMHYHRLTEMNIKKQVDLVAGFVRPIPFTNEEGEKEIRFETQLGVQDTIGLEGMLIVIESDKRGRVALTEDVEKVLKTPLPHPMKAHIVQLADAIFSIDTQCIFAKAQEMETKEKQLQFFHDEVRKVRIEAAKKCTKNKLKKTL